MINKNKVMDIKIIFKTYLKILKIILGSQIDFCSKKQKIVLENSFQIEH